MRKVLLIDDDEDVHALIRAQLQYANVQNVELISAMSGEEGAKKYIEEGANAVLLDLRMPNGDGVFTTKKILQHDPAAKIFIMTAYPSSSKIEQALSAGALGVINKAGQYSALIIAFVIAIMGGGAVT